MTELLKELEAVVAAQSNPKEWIGVALKFMDTHHAEIAEAVREARFMKVAETVLYQIATTPRNAGARRNANAAMRFIETQRAAAIDAHNSAREVGE